MTESSPSTLKQPTARGVELTSEVAREGLLHAKRPTSLPLAPKAPVARRKLPLAAESRPIDRAWRPIYAVWEITLKCDLACRHCGSRAGKARSDELSTEQCFDLIEQMAELGVKEVTIIGGEAYLRPDWLDIVRKIRDVGMQSTMTTGGRGITPEHARAAREAGLMSVSVSVDGLEETHDRLRGVTGSFQSAMAAIAAFRAAGVPVSANTQINRLSAREMPELLERLIVAGIHGWQLQLTVPMGRAVDEPDVLLQPYDLLKIFPMVAELKRRTVEARVTLWPGNNLGYFGPYESLLRGSMPEGHLGSCGAGRGTLGIEADGTIKGCPSLPTREFAGGNVLDNRLVDIWERAEALRFTRDRQVPRDLWGYCATCYYADTCRAGCTWTGFTALGKAGNNPYCHHRALEFERIGKRERLVLASPAPGEPFDHGRFDLIEEDIPSSSLSLETASPS
ncbi:MAG: radical SAM protein [Polyangiaceae bacterium]|nr:radical SAM protein [Polyangiaceae bacterium]